MMISCYDGSNNCFLVDVNTTTNGIDYIQDKTSLKQKRNSNIDWTFELIISIDNTKISVRA